MVRMAILLGNTFYFDTSQAMFWADLTKAWEVDFGAWQPQLWERLVIFASYDIISPLNP